MQLLREECISKLAEKYTSIHMPEINLPEFDGDFVCKSNNYVIVKADSYTGDKRRINREFEVSGIKFYKLGLSLIRIIIEMILMGILYFKFYKIPIKFL